MEYDGTNIIDTDINWYDLLDEDDVDEDQSLIWQYEREMGITITLDEALFLIDHPDEEAKFKRKQNRIKNCGSWSNWYDPHTGQRAGYFFHCGVFRECSRCLEKRAEKELNWLKKSFLFGKLDSLTLIVADRDTIVRRLRDVHKTKYVRYPQSDGADILLANTDLNFEGEQVDLNWIMNQDWKEIVCTPQGRNKSGTIHIPKSEKNPAKFSIITTQQFTSNADQNIVNEVMDTVVSETNEMDPESAVEVEDCINERSRYAVARLQEKGYVTSIFVKKVKVIHAQISWQESYKARQNSRLINSLNTKNLTSKQQELQLVVSDRPPNRPPDR